MYKEIKLYDPDATIIKWIQEKEDKVLDNDVNKYPKDPVTIQSFFEGVYPNKKAGRVYLRLRIYSPEKQGILFRHLK